MLWRFLIRLGLKKKESVKVNDGKNDNIKYKKIRINSKNKVRSPLRNNMSHSKLNNNL